MKKVVIALMGALFFGSALNFAVAKELTPKEVVEKAAKQYKTDKEGKKLAKKQEKDNWKSWESMLPMEKQYALAFAYEYATDDNNEKYFFSGQGVHTAKNRQAAYAGACRAGREDLAYNMETSIAGGGESELVDINGEASIKNQQTAKDIFASKIAGLQPIVAVYKHDSNGYTVQVRYFYPRSRANAIAAEAFAKQNKVDDGLKKDVDDQLKKIIDK